jgi:hypothetical protein
VLGIDKLRGAIGLTCRVGGEQKVTMERSTVYFQGQREQNRESVKVLAPTDVALVDVLDDYALLIVYLVRLMFPYLTSA